MSQKPATFKAGLMFQSSKIFRLLVVAVSVAAWINLSNHCSIAGTLSQREAKASSCPMHGHKEHAPQRKHGNDCGDVPCCKNLHATAAVAAKLVAKPIWLGTLQLFAIVVVAPVQPAAHQFSRILDNGPPGENTFAELVLQRSLLAHAPPFLV